MTYKDLNVYQRAYRAAIDLHLFLKSNKIPISSQNEEELRRLSREIFSDLALGCGQRTPKSRRYFNFKALEAIRSILMDLEFLHDLQVVPQDVFKHLSAEYEICLKQIFKLNQSILNKAAERIPAKEAVAP